MGAGLRARGAAKTAAAGGFLMPGGAPGKGSLFKGLTSRPTGLAAGFLAPAAAAAIGFAIAKPVSRALSGVSGRIERGYNSRRKDRGIRDKGRKRVTG